MNPLALRLEIWHPSDASNRCFAELRYNRNIGGILSVSISSDSDSILPNTIPNFLNKTPLPRLEGRCIYNLATESPTSTLISLHNITKQGVYGIFGTSVARYEVSDIYIGEGVPKTDDFYVSEMVCEFGGLQGWLDPEISRSGSGHNDMDSWKMECPLEDVGNITVQKESFSAPIIIIKYDPLRSISESDAIISYIQNLFTLGSGNFPPLLFLKYKLENEQGEATRYRKMSEPYEIATTYHDAAIRHFMGRDVLAINSVFLFKQLCATKGMAEWVRVMEKMAAFGDPLPHAVNKLIEGHIWNPSYSEDSFQTTVFALLSLFPETSSLRKIEQRLFKAVETVGEKVIPQYIDKEWCNAVSFLRSKIVVHYEDQHTDEYPETLANIAREIVYKIGQSFVLKTIMGVPENILKEKIWEERLSKKDYSKSSLELKNWYQANTAKRRVITKKNLETLREARVTNIHRTFTPTRVKEIPKRIFHKKSKERIFKCRKCETHWKLTGKEPRLTVSIKGRHNSPTENQWFKIFEGSTLMECENAAKKSLSQHFCAKPDEYFMNGEDEYSVTYRHGFRMYDKSTPKQITAIREIKTPRGIINNIKLGGNSLPLRSLGSVIISESGDCEATWMGLTAEEVEEHFKSVRTGHCRWEYLQICYKDGRKEAVAITGDTFVGQLEIHSGKNDNNGLIVKIAGKVEQDGK